MNRGQGNAFRLLTRHGEVTGGHVHTHRHTYIHTVCRTLLHGNWLKRVAMWGSYSRVSRFQCHTTWPPLKVSTQLLPVALDSISFLCNVSATRKVAH